MSTFSKDDVIDNKYRVMTLLGEGGFGEVYLVKTKHETEQALKLCTEDDPIMKRRFKKEANKLSELDNKYIIKIHDISMKDDLLYYTMPVAKIDLYNLVKKKPTYFDLDVVLKISLELCHGLAYLHENGVLHRDISPKNCLFIENSFVVSDFGFVKDLNSLSTMITNDKNYVFTPGFIDSEIDCHNDFNEQSDIFALGMTMYFMASKGDIRTSPDYSRIDNIVSGIIRKCLTDRRCRYHNVPEIIDDLNMLRNRDNIEQPLVILSRLLGEYKASTNIKDVVPKIMIALIDLKSENTFYNTFRQLENNLLEFSLRKNILHVKDIFIRFIDVTNCNLNFGEVEHVTEKLLLVVKYCDDSDLQKKAFERAFLLSTSHNRYMAMQQVGDILQTDKINNIVSDIAIMFRCHKTSYEELIPYINIDELPNLLYSQHIEYVKNKKKDLSNVFDFLA